jgi:uncharacterized protein (UPF0332 family)
MGVEPMLKNQIEKMIRKSYRSLDAARAHLTKGDFDFSASRAYYAAFYAIEAILLSKNLTFSKHGGTIGAFNHHFIKTGVFPREFSDLIARLFRERQVGDYEFDEKIGKESAADDIECSLRIANEIRAYLLNNGFLNPQ